MKFLGIALLLFSIAALGQDAKVIALSPADAARAKALYAQRAQIEKQIAALNSEIEDKYTVVHDFRGQEATRKLGWFNGFMFSEDFKYIVPKIAPAPVNCGLGIACFTSSDMNVITPVSYQ